jgi:adenosylcobinamide-GDP ribazoletransferase
MRKISLAFQFLTIIPLGNMADVSEKEIGGASAFFPLTGLVQGFLLCISAFLFLKVFPSELTNGFLILVIVITNGGFHLDGLADTFDAIATRGGKEKKLAIMKDSTVGPIGAIAIIIAILLKYLLLNTLSLNATLTTYYTSLFLMPLFSRWVMVPAIFHAQSAKQDGLGKIFIENTGLRELSTSTFLALLISLFFLFVVNKISYPGNHFLLVSFQFLFVLPVLYIFSLIAVWFFNKRFGGMTGDTFGAVSEISEILFLMVVVIWVLNCI